MKKLLSLCLFLGPSWAYASGHLEARRADIITIGTLPNNVLDNSSVTKMGPVIPLGSLISNPTNLSTYYLGSVLGNANTVNCIGFLICSTVGSTWTIQGTAAAPNFAGSTQTLTLEFPGGVYQSTIDVEAVSGMSYSMGVDSGGIVGFWADALSASTVTGSANYSAYTGLQLSFSTGGANPVREIARAPLVSLGTASAVNQGGFSGYVTTRIPVGPFETFFVDVTTVPSSGKATTGLKFHIDLWTGGRF